MSGALPPPSERSLTLRVTTLCYKLLIFFVWEKCEWETRVGGRNFWVSFFVFCSFVLSHFGLCGYLDLFLVLFVFSLCFFVCVCFGGWGAAQEP